MSPSPPNYSKGIQGYLKWFHLKHVRNKFKIKIIFCFICKLLSVNGPGIRLGKKFRMIVIYTSTSWLFFDPYLCNLLAL